MSVLNRNLYDRTLLRRRHRRRTYRLKEILNDPTYSDIDIRNRYRFRRQSINYLVELLRDDLERPTRRNHALSVETQILIALRFFACGSYQQVIGDVIGVDKSSVCRVIPKFCQAQNRKKGQFIKFPSTNEEKLEIKQGFYRMAGFPSTIGCIDCTHVRISAPHENE